jgi:2-methylcitrate dehydratase PrpD
MARIASVQHQIAAALHVPALAAKVRVQHGPHLDRHYPGAWPAQVTIRMGRRRLTRSLLYPSGDWRNPLSWAGLAAKLDAVAARTLIDLIRSAKPQDPFPVLGIEPQP